MGWSDQIHSKEQSGIETQPRTIRLGVIGGGQLALMLGEAAREMGFAAFTVLDPTPGCPAAPVASGQVMGSFRDAEAIQKLASVSDLLTIEIEQVDAGTLDRLERSGKPVHPSAQTVALIQDKLRQKEFLQQQGIAVAPFRAVVAESDLREAAAKFGYPLILKARTQGYDGRGNVVIQTEAEIAPALERLKDRPLYVEQHVPFVKELAVMVARSTNGEVSAFPVVETQHRRNICHVVIAPAPVDPAVAEKARKLALAAVAAFQSAGIFGVELFLTANGDVFLNEIAPRPHNSGHYSIEACHTSQYEQHLRAICGLPLGSTEMLVPSAVMVNILGEDRESHPAQPAGIEQAQQLGAHVHLYGKHQSVYDRKMGHLTVLGDTLADTLHRAEQARAKITI